MTRKEFRIWFHYARENEYRHPPAAAVIAAAEAINNDDVRAGAMARNVWRLAQIKRWDAFSEVVKYNDGKPWAWRTLPAHLRSVVRPGLSAGGYGPKWSPRKRDVTPEDLPEVT
jgi:hypothetical protein